MSSVEVLEDVKNAFLLRRELVCRFADMGGRLKKLDAAGMVSEKLGLEGKVIVPVSMGTQVGMSSTTGTFYVYDDEGLARKQVDPSVMARFDKARKATEGEAAEAKPAEGEAAEAKPAEGEAADTKPAEGEAADTKPAEGEGGAEKE